MGIQIKRTASFIKMRDLVYHNGLRAAERLPPIAPLLMPVNKILEAQSYDDAAARSSPESSSEAASTKGKKGTTSSSSSTTAARNNNNKNGAGASFQQNISMPTSAFESSQRSESFEILYTYPARGIFSGVARATWNLALSTSCCMLLPLAKTIVDTQQKGMLGLVTGPVTGLGYAAAMWWIGGTSGFLQVITGAINSILSPFQKNMFLNKWHAGEGVWRHRTAVPDEWLRQQRSDEQMAEAAAERQARLNGKRAAASRGRLGGNKAYYTVLAVDTSATVEEIKRAYRNRAKILHPDRNPSPSAQSDFEELNKAYSVLSDPEKRKKYDAGGEAAVDRSKLNMRAALRSVMGGSTLAELTGDPLHTRHCRLVIEDVWYSGQDAIVVEMRMREQVTQNLLRWLDGYKVGDDDAISQFEQDVWDRFPDMTNTGLGKEVMFAVGKSLKEAVAFVGEPTTTSPVARAQHAASLAWRRNVNGRMLAFLSTGIAASKKLSTEEFTMNVLWKLSNADIQYTVFDAAVCVMADKHTSVTDSERERRRAAVKRLSELLLEGGAEFKGADRNTIDRIAAAVRIFQATQGNKKSSDDGGGCSSGGCGSGGGGCSSGGCS